MKNHRIVLGVCAALGALAWVVTASPAQDKAPAKGTTAAAAASTTRVYMVITNQAQRGTDVPTIQTQDVKVKMGRDFAKVNQVIPARADNAALQLIILIDDTLDPSTVGNNLNDIRDFINAQPESTAIGVAYMSNATISIAQQFTVDHAAAAKAVRLPRGALSTMDSAYLSVISLVKGWAEQKIRREILVIGDGINRARHEGRDRSMGTGRSGFGQTTGGFPPGYGPGPGGFAGFGPVYHSQMMTTISPDVDTASEVSQRAGTIVHAIYAVGVGSMARSTWDLEAGLAGLTKLTEETGGECFSLGTTNAVSFKPYLERLQRLLDNQYYLVFQAAPAKKSTLKGVSISTEVPNSEITAADNVWVPVGK
jgi:hypothetical protein